MSKLILMVGLPFSGKTTRAKQLEKEYNAMRLTPDEWHVKLFGQDVYSAEHDKRHSAIEDIMIDLAFKILEKGQNVILDFGFWSIEERIFFRDKAKKNGFDFAICYCECPENELEERMNKRNNDPNNPYFYISIDKYKEYVKIFQKPSNNEGEFIETKIDTRI